MSSQISPEAQRAIDRLRKIDPAKPALDRTAVDKALRAQLTALDLSDRPIVWVADAQDGYARVTAAARDAARNLARVFAGKLGREHTRNLVGGAVTGAASSPDWEHAWLAVAEDAMVVVLAAIREATSTAVKNPAGIAEWGPYPGFVARDAASDAAGVAAGVAAWEAVKHAASDAARAAPRDAPCDAARAAACDAAWEAARAAGWNAAWAAGRNAGWNAAWAAAGDAANDATGDAASDVARAAAGDAAWDAVRIAAWDGASACGDLNHLTVFDHPAQHKLAGIGLPMIDAYEAGLFLYWVRLNEIVCVPAPALSLRDGRLHNEAGPAVEWPSGERYWFRNGIQVPQ